MSKIFINSFLKNLRPISYKIPLVRFYDKMLAKILISSKIRNSNKEKPFLDRIINILPTNNIDGINQIEKKEIIKSAEKILTGTYNVLGSGDVMMDPIDWHSDFKSSFTWPKGKYYKKYIQVQLENSSDVKVPRELSRSHHLLHVALAYNLTKREEFANFFCSQIINWIKENPLMYSINWGCAMDVSIRAVNWIWCIGFLSDYDWRKNTNELLIIEKSLFEHGWFIYRNLEGNIFNYSNNHYLSNLTGLIFLGQLFKPISDGKKWLDYAELSFYREIRIQILPSGLTYERSLHYNRLVLELILWPIISFKCSGKLIPQDIWSRLENMFNFILHTCRPDGSCPIIGDQDNGRLLPFGTEEVDDFQYLLSIGSILFKRSDFKKYDNGYNIYCALLGEKYNINLYNKIEDFKGQIKSIGFKDAGFYLMRNDKNYLIFNGATRGLYSDKKSSGIHTHSDLFSFDLFINDKAFIVDPGTFTYTSNKLERNLFRGTRKHNTVVVDGQNQDKLSENDLFQMSKSSTAKIKKWTTNQYHDIISAEHNGYMRLKEPVNHLRTITFEKLAQTWLIIDQLTGSGIHDFEVMFHFNENIKIEIVDEKTIISKSKGLNIKLSFSSNSVFKIVKELSYISKSYGTKVKSHSINIKSTSSCPFNLETRISVL